VGITSRSGDSGVPAEIGHAAAEDAWTLRTYSKFSYLPSGRAAEEADVPPPPTPFGLTYGPTYSVVCTVTV
jgi:hypothetical protein